jgi:hypothetical protein
VRTDALGSDESDGDNQVRLGPAGRSVAGGDTRPPVPTRSGCGPPQRSPGTAQEAQARTVELREELSDLLRKLSASYAEAARQREQLADNRRHPVQFDHRTTAKSWRALADTASLTARRWEETRSTGEATPTCPRCSKPVPREVLLELALGAASAAECPRCGGHAELALRPAKAERGAAPADEVFNAIADEGLRIANGLNDVVVAKLFAAGLRLNGALSLTTGRAARQRLTEAIDEVDESIVAIRNVAFGLTKDREQDA